MKLCRCCKGFIATNYFVDVPVCRECFMGLKHLLRSEEEIARMKEEAAAITNSDLHAQFEIERLEYWASFESEVNR